MLRPTQRAGIAAMATDTTDDTHKNRMPSSILHGTSIHQTSTLKPPRRRNLAAKASHDAVNDPQRPPTKPPTRKERAR